MSSSTQDHLVERVIRPRHGLAAMDFSELWRYRELFWELSWRNVLIRYKQTMLGIAWAVIQPLLTMVVFTVVFSLFGKLSSQGAPYALLVLAALVPWQFFSNAMSESSNSLIASQGMITKVYFPRAIIPASAVLSGMIDFLISLVLLFGLMLWYDVPFTLRLLALPVFALLAFLAAFGTGLWLSALNVKYRDVKYVVPFLTRIGMYATPVGFAVTVVPEKWLFWFYSLNPLVGIVEGFRWCILGSNFEPMWVGVINGAALIILLLISGAYYFRTTERTFADVI